MPFPRPAFRRFVRIQSQPLTVHRRDDMTSSNWGNETTYTELSNPRDIVVGGVSESMQPTPAGENQAQRLVAYTTSGTDLQVNDRIEYGGETYEVLTKTGHPDENDPAIHRYELDDT